MKTHLQCNERVAFSFCFEAFQPASLDVIMAAGAYVKVVEYKLLLFRKEHTSKTRQHSCEKVLNSKAFAWAGKRALKG